MSSLHQKSILLAATIFFTFISCNSQKTGPVTKEAAKYKVTFIELGSTRCIPCRQMQPVIKSIGEKYGTQVKVIFYDVWTEAGAPYGKLYNIEAIPTQIFLDANGKEYFRHTGYFPEEELVKVLKDKGIN